MGQKLNSNNLKIFSSLFTKEDIELLYHNYFSCWVSSLYFGGEYIFLSKFKRKPSYEEKVEMFLALFKTMIDNGLILAIAPISGEPEKEIDGKKFWDVSSDIMVEYIRSVLPKNLKFLETSVDDENENAMFWYSRCPEINWIDQKTRKWV